MNCTADFIEGIIRFADAHPRIDRQDISNAVFNLIDAEPPFDFDNAESEEIISALETELASEI